MQPNHMFLYVFLRLVESIWFLYRNPFQGVMLALVFLAVVLLLFRLARKSNLSKQGGNRNAA